MKKIYFYFKLAKLRKRIAQYWKEYSSTNDMYAKYGCFEGPYWYSAPMHRYVEAEKRCAVRLYVLYMGKLSGNIL